jgi:hypothetical protein
MREDESVDMSEEELDRLAGVKLNDREVSLHREFEKCPLMSHGPCDSPQEPSELLSFHQEVLDLGRITATTRFCGSSQISRLS